MIYLDNASTSYPKPQEVSQKINEYLTKYGVSPGRGSHYLADKAASLIEETREMLMPHLGIEHPNSICFTNNATHSLNIAINGTLSSGDHVLCCSYSHNSVIRPLEHLKRARGIEYSTFPVDEYGNIDFDKLEATIQTNSRLVILNHVSNVFGADTDAQKVGEICRKHNLLFLLDCTQSLGYLPINAKRFNADFIAGTGHKTLLGPTGVGFLYVRDPKKAVSLIQGGSGGNHSISPLHPSQMPLKFEAGTLNCTAIAGLNGSLHYINKKGFNHISEQGLELCQYTWEQLEHIDEVILYGPSKEKKRVPIIAFNLRQGLTNEVAFLYDREYKICLRGGIHCTPTAHKKLGTFPSGTLRISPGHFNTKKEIDTFIKVTKQMIKEKQYAKTCA